MMYGIGLDFSLLKAFYTNLLSIRVPLPCSVHMKILRVSAVIYATGLFRRILHCTLVFNTSLLAVGT